MGMRMLETCWAVFKWQVINLRICCIWLIDSFEFNKLFIVRNFVLILIFLPQKCLTKLFLTAYRNINGVKRALWSYLHRLTSPFLDFSLCLWNVRHKEYEHTALLTLHYKTHTHTHTHNTHTHTHTQILFVPFSTRKTDMRISYGEISCCLTLILLTWRIWWAPNNASKWQMRFNLAFKGLM